MEPNSLCILIGELNLVGRCVARSPKEMVRQVAAARELDSIEVQKNVKEHLAVTLIQ